MTIKTSANLLLITASELFLNLSEDSQRKAVSYLSALLASEQQESASLKKDHDKVQ